MISVWRELRCASPAAETAGMPLSSGTSSPLFPRTCSLAFDPERSLGDRHRVRVSLCVSLGSRLRCLHVPCCCDQRQQFSLGLSGCVPHLPGTASPISTCNLLGALVDLLLDS